MFRLLETEALNVYFSHLDGTVLHSGGVVLDTLTRPSLLITDSYNSKVVHPARKDRYAAMFGKCFYTH